MFKNKLTRGLALVLTLCMIIGMVPMQAIAVDLHPGDTITTPDKNPPAPVEGAVWVLTDSIECKKIVHTHNEKCFYQSCDHKDGHLSSCYSESTAYALCEHADETQHTGSVTLTDVVTIDGTNVAWKTEHPAYPAVYAVYKAAYDEAYASTKLSWLKETAAKAAGVAALLGKTFCYTTSASATPDKCTHGECSDWTGACYSKLCILEEHQHVEACYQYTWTLKADLNKNGVADDADEYFVVKYVSDGVVVYEEAVLVGMPTPTVQAPKKAADAQYTYEFAGWDIPVADTVTGDVVYTAVYTNITNKYTVTWVDEDGTELEKDEGVEYGQMPQYNSELPTKKGDNTIVYTFGGWTPSVDKVTGDVTYTATYTSKDVFEVKFFIDNELQKTEYVIEGTLAPAYAPTREHYVLTTWMNGDTAYDFNQAVTAALELHSTWRLTESVVTTKAQNADVAGAGLYNIGDEIVITATPKEGYAVSAILVNGTSVPVSYKDGIATIKLTAEQETYEIDVQTKRVYLTLKPAEMNIFGDLSAESIFNNVYSESYPELKFGDVKVEYLAFSIEIFNKTYEWWVAPGTNVSLEAFLDQYGLGALASYIPVDSQPHAFGAQSTEQVRVSYAGSEKFCATYAETTVAMVDLRAPSEIILNQDVVVTYGATAEDILKLVFKSVTSDNGVITENYQDVTIKMDSLNAGTRKAIVSFNGNTEYAASVAEVEVTIKKATGKLDIESYTGKYGTDVNASQMFTSNGNRIEMAMGLYAGDNASANAGSVIYVNLPQLIDLSTISNDAIRELAEKVLDGVNEKLSGTMTIAELKEALENALPYVETIEDMGYEINITASTINMLVKALDELSNINGAGDISLKVSIDQDIILKDAGAYLMVGMVADANYTLAMNVGYAVITPDGYRAELGWNVEDQNGIITLEALRNSYDMGASAISVNQGNLADANAHVYTVFFGVNKDGEMILTRDQKTLGIGAYAQFAFMADLGNTMYYAEPIMRSFIVAADIVNVQFVDKNGNVNSDRVFDFGEDATMNAVAFDRVTGEVETNGSMTYLYMGMQANGEFYRDTKAPARPGAYTVIAVFIGNDEMNVGAAVGALVINPIEPSFTAADKTVQYDGNEHKVDLQDDAGMQHAYLIVDQDGNINLVLPEVIADLMTGQAATLNEVLEQLEKIDLEKLASKLPKELVEYYDNYVSAVKMKLGELKKEYGVNAVSINGAFPSEIGVYEFHIIGFKNLEYQLGMTHATLTIKCEHAYDHDCDTDCNLCGETREVELHKETYIDRFDSSCVKHGYEKIRCKACHEVLSEVELPLSEEHAYYNGVCLLCQAKEHCEHNYEIVKELAPTCVEPGYVWTVCSECGAEKNYEVGEATGVHGDTYIDRFESTCVKHGYEKTRCKVCHEVLSEIELPLSEEHVYHNGACLLCGKEEACKHDYVVERELKPTCGEAGYVWTKCSKCGEEKNYEVGEPTGEHTFDNACDATCNGCDHTREVGEHVYDNACDTDCNICGAERVTTHVYDNACDAQCNICEATREVGKHQYVGTETKAPECGAAGEKTYTCTECGHSYTEPVDATGDHTYDNNCDAECNNCKQTREVGEHIYTNACDDDCNECGAKRTPSEHVYDNACDANCNVCDEARVPAAHQYDNKCDAECNECGTTREVGEHVYSNACDKDCNECGAERTPAEHVYDDEYDADCNVCGATREVPEKPCTHEYDNACDATCNKCGETREVAGHAYDDEYDATCNECGAEREVPEKPGDVEEPPKTGDNSNTMLWLILALVSGVMCIVILFGRKRYAGKYNR